MRNDELINEDETHLLFKENKVLIKNISNGIMRSLIVWNLSKKSLHGYNLMKKIDEFFKPQIEAGLIKNVSHSKVYPILNQMEEEGLLKSRIAFSKPVLPELFEPIITFSPFLNFIEKLL